MNGLFLDSIILLFADPTNKKHAKLCYNAGAIAYIISAGSFYQWSFDSTFPIKRRPHLSKFKTEAEMRKQNGRHGSSGVTLISIRVWLIAYLFQMLLWNSCTSFVFATWKQIALSGISSVDRILHTLRVSDYIKGQFTFLFQLCAFQYYLHYLSLNQICSKVVPKFYLLELKLLKNSFHLFKLEENS